MDNERWEPIVIAEREYPYEISKWGRVRRSQSGKGTWVGRILKSAVQSDGYPQVRLSYKRGVQRTFRVHVLVANAFLGPRPSGMHVHHKNGDKTNNHIHNLQYVTPTTNSRAGSRTKLSPDKVKAIREDMKILTEKYNIASCTLYYVASGYSWGDVE